MCDRLRKKIQKRNILFILLLDHTARFTKNCMSVSKRYSDVFRILAYRKKFDRMN